MSVNIVLLQPLVALLAGILILVMPRLLNIIAAFDLNPAGEDLAWMSDAQLVTFIVTATEAQLSRGVR